MSNKTLDPSTLKAFGNVAAGHDGVLSDPTGALVIKPCTPAEIAFYESVTASHPDLAAYIPTYMGTLSLNAAATAEASTDELAEGMIQTADGTLERLHGKKLATELSIVLENTAAGFSKPNILDLKLGAQLWDEGAKPEKRARLDKVSKETTSSSLGFRIAGMRTWAAVPKPVAENLKSFAEVEEDTGYTVYNKMYGRKFAAWNVLEGFEAYVLPPGTKKGRRELERAKRVLVEFVDGVRELRDIFRKKESRMYSASILLVFEGDAGAFDEREEVLKKAPARKEVEAEVEDEDEDDDEEDELPKLVSVKMIDFAHATWTPGQGRDENALQGISSTLKLLVELLGKVNAEIAML
ncbi:SAICAR synthase-like protein [Lophium mytilinum]|uniref:Kinase n=1 Tax=Lophium mytilinum TaxID=390894 RepID=A0A6A6R103_9PEZI|nr:SAICAR synthase-like protein [Lophium mytilinum]